MSEDVTCGRAVEVCAVRSVRHGAKVYSIRIVEGAAVWNTAASAMSV